MSTALWILAGLGVLAAVVAVGATSEWLARRRRRLGMPPRRPDQDRSKQKPDHGYGL